MFFPVDSVLVSEVFNEMEVKPKSRKQKVTSKNTTNAFADSTHIAQQNDTWN